MSKLKRLERRLFRLNRRASKGEDVKEELDELWDEIERALACGSDSEESRSELYKRHLVKRMGVRKVSGYDKDDAARDTNSSRSKVGKAWHDAREAARSDSRSDDPGDVGYTGDWDKG